MQNTGCYNVLDRGDEKNGAEPGSRRPRIRASKKTLYPYPFTWADSSYLPFLRPLLSLSERRRRPAGAQHNPGEDACLR
jgi:hypothetical protein